MSGNKYSCCSSLLHHGPDWVKLNNTEYTKMHRRTEKTLYVQLECMSAGYDVIMPITITHSDVLVSYSV